MNDKLSVSAKVPAIKERDVVLHDLKNIKKHGSEKIQGKQPIKSLSNFIFFLFRDVHFNWLNTLVYAYM